MKDEDAIKVTINYQSPAETAEKLFIKNMEAHFKTVFVGGVCEIEKEFGILWGESDEFDENVLTDDQKIWYEKFLSVRERIFDQGNKQKKIAINKFKQLQDIMEKYNGRA